MNENTNMTNANGNGDGNGNGSSTGLAVLNSSQQTSLSIYDKVDPMDFISKIGKAFAQSGAGGCKTQADGEVMALACLSLKQHVFEISARYHLIEGKLTKKSETMLADFRRAGGKHKWIKDGTDYREAVIELTSPDGETITIGMTLERAKSAGYVKSGSGWVKRPDQMLRARCISDGIRMLCPEISGGYYTEEEVGDLDDSPKNGSGTAKPTRTKEEVAKRAAELKATANGQPATTVANSMPATTSIPAKEIEQPPFDVGDTANAGVGDAADPSEGEIIDASFEVVNGEVATTPSTNEPVITEAARVEMTTTMEIELVISQCGWQLPEILSHYNKKAGTNNTDFSQFSPERQQIILKNLRDALDKHQAAKLAAKEEGAAAATAQ